MGVGASQQQMDRSCHSHTEGKNMMLGVTLRKEFFKHLDTDTSLYGMASKYHGQRYGAPSPSQSYIARSRYNTGAVTWRTESGWVAKVGQGFSFKPTLGLQLNYQRRSAIKELNAGAFNQRYRTRVSRNGEVWTGIGVRKAFNSDTLEGKLTFKYDIGCQSGNGKSSTRIYAESVPDGIVSQSKTPGKTVHYFSVFGSVLNKGTNWKIAPGVTSSVQKGLTTVTGTVKLEYRW
jgi:hypothetical protein